MLTFLGIFVIIVGIATLIIKPLFKGNGLLSWFNTKRSLQIILVGIY
ncbi:hypothetical protein [Flagellimonas lutaonensis]|nr:hypothetical protein [Allomuricauda lutaonensis]